MKRYNYTATVEETCNQIIYDGLELKMTELQDFAEKVKIETSTAYNLGHEKGFNEGVEEGYDDGFEDVLFEARELK